MSMHLIVQTGWYWDAEFIGYFVAADEGLYAANGIEVTFLEGGPRVTPEQTVLNGSADVAITVRDTTMAMLADGAELEIVGVQYQADPLAVIVREESRVTSLSDLAGLRVAVPDVSRDGLLQGLVRAGVDSESVVTTSYDGTADALIAGDVDAVVGYVTSLPLDLANAGVLTRSLLLASAADDAPQNLLVAHRARSLELDATIAAWMRASAAGWRRNAHNPTHYPAALRATWFADTSRSVDDEVAHNIRQLEFMGDPERYLHIRSST